MTELKDRISGAERLALAVRLGRDLHAIPIDSVEEVLPALPIENVPQSPHFVRGVIFVRGHLIPVISGAERLGLRDYHRPLDPHIICLRVRNRLVGIEVDEAVDLISLDSGRMLEAHELGASEGFFQGMIDLNGFVVRLLNPDRLFDEGESAELSKIPKTESRR